MNITRRKKDLEEPREPGILPVLAKRYKSEKGTVSNLNHEHGK